MKAVSVIILSLIMSSCGLKERERELQKKTDEINQKEQQLLLKEKELQILQEEIQKRKEALDSNGTVVIRDTVAINPDFLGEWDVRMECIETNCSGSAVGDTRVENWIIEQKENDIIARAMSNNSLVRAYVGAFNGNSLVMISEQEDPSHKIVSRMSVRLQKVKNNQLEGRREINREGCKILYALELKRKETK